MILKEHLINILLVSKKLKKNTNIIMEINRMILIIMMN